MRLCIGDRVRYQQVTHDVIGDAENINMTIHDPPKSGVGVVVAAWKASLDAWRAFILPDTECNKIERTTILLRTPPDKIELLSV